jgi:hypothetical protein
MKVDIIGAKQAKFMSDNYLCHSPGEEKGITTDVLWRGSASLDKVFDLICL